MSTCKKFGGIQAVADILSRMAGSDEALVVSQVMATDAAVGRQIQDTMFLFDALAGLEDRDLQALLREVPQERLLLALKGTDDLLKEKIFRNLSQRVAAMLRDDLQTAAPAKLRDVEAARKEILAIAKRMAEDGKISLGGGKGDVYH